MGIKEVANGSRNVLVICGTVMFCFVMATAVAIVHIANDQATALSLIVILLGSLAPTLAALVVKGESIKQTAEDTNEKMDRVLNGEMAAKIKTAYKEALAESGRHPVAHPRASRSQTD